MNNSRPEFRTVIILSLVLSVLIPAIGSVYFIYFLPEWKLVNVSNLSTVESFESFAALSIASLILIMWRNNKLPGYYVWVSSALISMGVLYLLHALFPPGNLFAWLGRMAILTGGFLFTLVWLPDRYYAKARSTAYTIPIAVSIFSISLGAFSVAFPSSLPTIATNGDFTDAANVIHVLGGVLFLIAAAYFIIRYRSSGQINDILFFNFCMLNGWASLIFPFSDLWDACWWFIRLLRLAAYLTIVSFVLTSFQSNEKELIRVNEDLRAEVSERKRTEELLSESEEKYRILIDNSQDGVFIIQDGKIQFTNDAGAGMVGYTVEEIIGRNFQDFIAPEDLMTVAERNRRRHAGEDVPNEYEFQALHKDGKSRILVNMNVGLVQYHGRVASIGTLKNITEKKKLEAQLLRAQRMESVGTLSEGIAHDMNNVLSPIMLSLNMLKRKFTDSESQELLGILESGAKRGADLIKQVRSFALGVESEHKTLQICPLISEISQIAKETFPRNIEIQTNISEDLCATSGDTSQLHQVLMNLCINARDAMPDGGILRISAENVTIDENYARMNSMRQNTAQQAKPVLNCWEYKKCGREPGEVKVTDMGVCPAAIDAQVDGLNRGSKGGRVCWMVTGTFCGGQVQGKFAKNVLSCMNCDFYQTVRAEEGDQFIETRVGPYVVITVADTGVGIPQEIIDRIFEPFFTTKQPGKGTGLGLSTALGIVKSHGGLINVYSEVGKGSAFKVYLPAVQASEVPKMKEYRELTSGHGGLVLVVEDEEMICKITKSVLETHGYKVLIAHNGAEAIPLYEQNRDEIKVVIMDMMLPVMDGLTCIKTLREINPTVKVIAVSGLDRSESLAEGYTTPAQAFLPKPYTSDILLKTVHEVIEAKT